MYGTVYVQRMVTLEYYDGSWKSIGQAQANTSDGGFSYNWTQAANSNQIRATYSAPFDTSDGNPGDGIYYMGSTASVGITPPTVKYSLTVETHVDVSWDNINGLGVTVDGVTQYTSGGSATFSVTGGSHTISVPSTFSGRDFSHFYDATANKDTNYGGPTSYTVSISGNRQIAAIYKMKTQITSLQYNGSAVTGKLLNEKGQPLIPNGSSTVYGSPLVQRMVSLEFLDLVTSTWKNLATVQASSNDGSFTYAWTPSAGITGFRARYVAPFDQTTGTPGDGIFFMTAPTVESKTPVIIYKLEKAVVIESQIKTEGSILKTFLEKTIGEVAAGITEFALKDIIGKVASKVVGFGLGFILDVPTAGVAAKLDVQVLTSTTLTKSAEIVSGQSVFATINLVTGDVIEPLTIRVEKDTGLFQRQLISSVSIPGPYQGSFGSLDSSYLIFVKQPFTFSEPGTYFIKASFGGSSAEATVKVPSVASLKSKYFTVYYSVASGSAVSASYASDVAKVFDNAYEILGQRFSGTALTLPANPSQLPPVRIADLSGTIAGAYSELDILGKLITEKELYIDTSLSGSELLHTAVHELFHYLQYYNIPPAWINLLIAPKWFTEGTARWAENRILGEHPSFSHRYDKSKTLYEQDYGTWEFWNFLDGKGGKDISMMAGVIKDILQKADTIFPTIPKDPVGALPIITKKEIDQVLLKHFNAPSDALVDEFLGKDKKSTIIIEAHVDASWENLNGLGITVDEVTQYTSGGSATFSVTGGSHTISVPSTFSGRDFSHFYDATANKDTNYGGPTSYTVSISGNRQIAAIYKMKTQITSLQYNGSAVTGKLLNEKGQPLIPNGSSTVYGSPLVQRMVSLEYYDGSWKSIGQAQANTSDGSFSYTWSQPSGAISIRARFEAPFDKSDGNPGDGIYYMPSYSPEKVLPKPDLTVTSVSLSPTSAAAGASVTVSLLVKNQGTGTSGSFSAGIYLATSQWGTQTPLKTVALGSLLPEIGWVGQESVTIPSGTSAGSYWITMYADSGNAVTESNENNNINSAAFTVILPPEQNPVLVDVGISPPNYSVPTNPPVSVDPGEQFRAWYFITNPNDKAINVGLGLSIRDAGGKVTSDPSKDTTVSIPAKASSYVVSRFFTVPTTAAPGKYDVAYGLWKGDWSQQYTQLWKTGWLTVEGKPDLTLLSQTYTEVYLKSENLINQYAKQVGSDFYASKEFQKTLAELALNIVADAIAGQLLSKAANLAGTEVGQVLKQVGASPDLTEAQVENLVKNLDKSLKVLYTVWDVGTVDPAEKALEAWRQKPEYRMLDKPIRQQLKKVHDDFQAFLSALVVTSLDKEKLSQIAAEEIARLKEVSKTLDVAKETFNTVEGSPIGQVHTWHATVEEAFTGMRQGILLYNVGVSLAKAALVVLGVTGGTLGMLVWWTASVTVPQVGDFVVNMKAAEVALSLLLEEESSANDDFVNIYLMNKHVAEDIKSRLQSLTVETPQLEVVQLKASSALVGEEAIITISLKNTGNKAGWASGQTRLTTQGKTLGTIVQNKVWLEAGQTKDVIATFVPWQAGIYAAEARMEINGKTAPTKSVTFSVNVKPVVSMQVAVSPVVVEAGKSVTIDVWAKSGSQNLSGSQITLTTGGGYFQGSNQTSISGYTDASGKLSATWFTGEPKAYSQSIGYLFKVRADKVGHVAATSSFVMKVVPIVKPNLKASIKASETLLPDGTVALRIEMTDIKDAETGSPKVLAKGIKRHKIAASFGTGFQVVKAGAAEAFSAQNVDIQNLQGKATMDALPVLGTSPSSGPVGYFITRLASKAGVPEVLSISTDSLQDAETGQEIAQESPVSLKFVRGKVRKQASEADLSTIGLADALYLAQHLSGQRKPEEINLLNAASINHDGAEGDKVTKDDLQVLVQYLMGQRDDGFNPIP